MNKGAYFVNAQTSHAPNVTGVGHAAMLTGALPYAHGIIANYWYDSALHDKLVCTYDPNHAIIGSTSGDRTGRSPRNLLVTTVGDELKNAMGSKPIVATVSLKDRAAILMGGHRANIAIWYDSKAKQWVTSSYYLNEKTLPQWLVKWSQFDYAAKKVPETWTKLLPEAAYQLSTPLPPDAIPKKILEYRGLGKGFPYSLRNGPDIFLTSPWGNAYVLDTALEMIKNMHLGADEYPDLLGISLSSFDMLGHNFGPLSAEMQDTTVRLDRMLASFLESAGQLVPGGMKNVTLVLTADHGIPVPPLIAEKLKLPGGGYWPEEWQDKANAELRSRLKLGSSENPVIHFGENNVTLDHALLKKNDKDPVEAARILATWLRTAPFVIAAHAKVDLLEGRVPPTQASKKLAVSVHPLRSGDVVYATRFSFAEMPNQQLAGVDHESPGVQDASIPLIFVGSAFKAQRSYEMVSLNDLAPTLSALLGIIPPSGSEGKVLTSALKATP